MSFDSAASSAGGTIPLLPVEPGKPGLRVRFLGKLSCDLLAGTIYEDGPIDQFQHWVPEELATELKIKGASVPCIGPRSGCIFHQAPLQWRASKKGECNVVFYKGWDAKHRKVEEKVILAYVGGVKIWNQIVTHSVNVGKRADEMDFLISRSGTGREDTAWNATVMPDLLDPNGIDLSEFPDQPNFGDDQIPVLIDFRKFPGREITTATQQQAWYDELIRPKDGSEGPAAEPPPAAASGRAPVTMPKPNAAPAATQAAPAAPPVQTRFTGPNGETWAGKGRKPGWYVAAEAAAAGGAAPVSADPPAPDSGDPPAPDDEDIQEAIDAFNAACQVLDPWKTPLGESTRIDFIVQAESDAAKLAKYKITSEILEAAKIVAAGDPSEAEDAPPPPPAATPSTPKAAAAAAPANVDVDALKKKFIALTKTSPLLREFPVMRKFLATACGGAKAFGQIDDPDQLTRLIAVIEQGDPAVEAAIAAGVAV